MPTKRVVYVNFGKTVIAVDRTEEFDKLINQIKERAKVVGDALDRVLTLENLKIVKSIVDKIYDNSRGVFIRLYNKEDEALWMTYTQYDATSHSITPVTRVIKLLDYEKPEERKQN